MSHDHSHHAPGMTLDRSFALGIGLNVVFVVVEIVFGVLAHSTALVADAIHNAGDVVGLGLAWGADVLARRQPSVRHTYGLRAGTILAALANAGLVLVAIGGVAWEAIGRIANPGPIDGYTVMAVAAVGIVVNAGSALLFRRSQKGDANVRAAFLHLAADAGVSLGVVIAGLAIVRTGWNWLDPVVSLGVSVLILAGTWNLLREALHLALAGVPDHVSLVAVRDYLCALPRVVEVHDLHIWPVGTSEVALTVHVTVPWTADPPEFLRTLDYDLHERFGIDHATVQLEPMEEGRNCRLAPNEVV